MNFQKIKNILKETVYLRKWFTIYEVNLKKQFKETERYELKNS